MVLDRQTTRKPFTDEEDELLVRYLALNNPKKPGRSGNNVYKKLVEETSDDWKGVGLRSWQGWRSRYVDNMEWFDYKIGRYLKKNSGKQSTAKQPTGKAEVKPKLRNSDDRAKGDVVGGDADRAVAVKQKKRVMDVVLERETERVFKKRKVDSGGEGSGTMNKSNENRKPVDKRSSVYEAEAGHPRLPTMPPAVIAKYTQAQRKTVERGVQTSPLTQTPSHGNNVPQSAVPPSKPLNHLPVLQLQAPSSPELEKKAKLKPSLAVASGSDVFGLLSRTPSRLQDRIPVVRTLPKLIDAPLGNSLADSRGHHRGAHALVDDNVTERQDEEIPEIQHKARVEVPPLSPPVRSSPQKVSQGNKSETAASDARQQKQDPPPRKSPNPPAVDRHPFDQITVEQARIGTWSLARDGPYKPASPSKLEEAFSERRRLVQEYIDEVKGRVPEPGPSPHPTSPEHLQVQPSKPVVQPSNPPNNSPIPHLRASSAEPKESAKLKPRLAVASGSDVFGSLSHTPSRLQDRMPVVRTLPMPTDGPFTESLADRRDHHRGGPTLHDDSDTEPEGEEIPEVQPKARVEVPPLWPPVRNPRQKASQGNKPETAASDARPQQQDPPSRKSPNPPTIDRHPFNKITTEQARIGTWSLARDRPYKSASPSKVETAYAERRRLVQEYIGEVEGKGRDPSPQPTPEHPQVLHVQLSSPSLPQSPVLQPDTRPVIEPFRIPEIPTNKRRPSHVTITGDMSVPGTDVFNRRQTFGGCSTSTPIPRIDLAATIKRSSHQARQSLPANITSTSYTSVPPSVSNKSIVSTASTSLLSAHEHECLTKYALEIVLNNLATKHGFAVSVVLETFNRIGGIAKTDEALQAIKESAADAAEEVIPLKRAEEERSRSVDLSTSAFAFNDIVRDFEHRSEQVTELSEFSHV